MSPFLAVFSTLLENYLPFSSNLKLSSANSFSLEESKTCRFGEELKDNLLWLGGQFSYSFQLCVDLHWAESWEKLVLGHPGNGPGAFPTMLLSKRRLISWVTFNFLPNDKIVDWSNLKAFADDKIYVTEKLKFVVGWVETLWKKGENAG